MSDPYAQIDRLEGALSDEWEDVMGDAMNRVMADIQGAASYDEARAVITGAFPQMKSARLIDQLVTASIQARAEGEASDG